MSGLRENPPQLDRSNITSSSRLSLSNRRSKTDGIIGELCYLEMRAIVCTRAIFSRFTENAATMRAPMSWDLLSSSGLGMTKIEKGSSFRQQKFTDYYTRSDKRQHALALSTLLLIVTIFVFLVCMIDTAWNVIDQRSPLSLEPTAASLLAHQTRRALQQSNMSSEVDLEARQKAGALHGMGITFRTGSRVMNELIVAHLAEPTTAEELRMFLRTLHRSGATARADVVLLFPWSVTNEITAVVDEEDRSFQRLILDRQATAPPHRKKVTKPETGAQSENGAQDFVLDTNQQEQQPSFPPANFTISPFNAKAFWKSREERKAARGEMTWDTSISNESHDVMSTVDWADWGSIVGFEMRDLDQDEVLHGFIEDPPAQLRRWICYQMLLGLTKAKYRTVLLTEVSGVFILRDVLAAARKKAFGQGINLYEKDLSWNDLQMARKKRLSTSMSRGTRDISSNSAQQDQDRNAHLMSNRMMGLSEQDADSGSKLDKEEDPLLSKEESRILTGSLEMHFIEEVYGKEVWKFLDKEDKERLTLGSGFIMGSMKPVRSFSSAILTEIAAVALKRKSRQPFHDGAILNYIVRKSSTLSRKVAGKLHLLSNNDASVHSLPGSRQPSFFFRDNGHGFAALVGLHEEFMAKEKRSAIGQSIRAEICSSKVDSSVYRDCSPVEGSAVE